MPAPRHSRVTAVIMAGGRGERLWPRSRAALPKQFTQLRVADTQGDRTLIQSTVDRIRPLIPVENIFVVTGSEWAGLAREQLPEIPGENVIVEPAARNTAPCIALATSIVRQRYRGEDPVVVVLPADHVIRDERAYRTALQVAIDVAQWPSVAYVASMTADTLPGAADEYDTGTAEQERRAWAGGSAEVAASVSDDAGTWAQARATARTGLEAGGLLPYPLVTLGIWPTRPETGYGYIRLGRCIGSYDGLAAYEAAQFTEKPDAVRAQHFVASGDYLWNSGMFVWRASAIWEAFRRYMPVVHAAFDDMEREPVTTGPVGSDCQTALDQKYRQLPAVSIDYGIMEKARPIVTIPCSFGWDDVGSWPALERLIPADEHSNVIEAEKCVAVDSHSCIVGQDAGNGQDKVGPGSRLIALLGVEDLIVVDTEKALLVASKSRAQDLKKLLERLRREGLEEYL